METWLADIRQHVEEKSPELLPLLDVYLDEARFGRRYIANNLAALAKGATVLEVGAGSLLLSCQLVREGFSVVALEPLGNGFTHFEKLRCLILERAKISNCMPELLDQRVEEFSEKDCFDFVFSINVMEHVDDVKAAMINVATSLRVGSSYRFTCPNYLFPYEPHFNIPTVYSKKITEKLFSNKISRNNELPDPKGTWKSLNWITVAQIKKIVSQMPELEVRFSRKLLASTLQRMETDKRFASRRPPWVRFLILKSLKLRVHHLVGLIPAEVQPIIDCTMTKASKI